MLLGPTTAFGSGGAEVTKNGPDGPLKPSPMPSNPTPSAGAAAVPAVDWRTGSGAELGAGIGGPFFGSFSFFFPSSAGGAGASWRRGGETSWWTSPGSSDAACAQGGGSSPRAIEPAAACAKPTATITAQKTVRITARRAKGFPP